MAHTPRTKGTTVMHWVDSIDAWTDWMVVAGYTANTIELRRYQIGQLADQYVTCSPWELTRDDLTAWLAAQTWARETRRSYRAAVRSFYTWAVDAGHIAASPAIKLPTVARKTHLPRPMPSSVYTSALAGADDQVRLCLLLLGYAGLRCAEAAQLHRNDIGERELRIHGKGDKERRVSMHRHIAAELDAELERRDAGGRGTGFRYVAGIDDGWIFPGRYGGHITADGIGQIVKRVVGSNWSAHTIRHAFACALYENTGDIAIVSALLGHSSLSTTQIYTKIPGRFLTAAVDAL